MPPQPNPRVFSQAARSIFRNFQRRRITTPAETNVEPPSSQTKFQKLWNSPVGPKTVHFWAPVMKWGVVLSGVADFARPADQLSLNTNAALMATGAIWTRWCFVIRPRNVLLASVNFLLFCVGATQVGRIFAYRSSQKGKGAEEVAKDAGKDAKATAVSVAEDPVGAIKGAVGK
ncbi:UPF0041-domain-containing protein [Aulographum hederae CBS 113979]|uniref:Mitochondrial pyruvate carrier n=1 Tax=Aulographum hederae CBS 113979 TaxID=1176131 RepID=A0A6G1H8C1_9PEZI|nr:UPF0041-domain-containing protein [Aulographum hederae CBS 113979]